jgi:copper chaperone CopZ
VSTPELEAIGFPVEGMTCSSCVSRITRHLRRVDGVRGVRVDLRAERVTVRRAVGTARDAELAAAVEAAGYRADLAGALAIAVPPERTLMQRLLGR